MKKYEKPEIKIVKFTTEDIMILSSIQNISIDGGSTSFKDSWKN